MLLNKQYIFTQIDIVKRLTKLILSMAVASLSIFAYILAGGTDLMMLGKVYLDVLLLAMGVSALNQYQERDRDAKMFRTMNRPIPAKQISPLSGVLIALFLITSGVLSVYIQFGNKGLFLSLFALIWYNGVYTFLKKYSAFAVIPGSLLGIVPLAIAWIAAQQSFVDPRFISLAALLFFWQIPHFWLLSVKYQNDYLSAHFPTALKTLGAVVFRRFLFSSWILTILAALTTIIVFNVHSRIVLILFSILIVITFILAIRTLSINLKGNEASKLFYAINIFLLSTLILLSLNTYLSS